LAKKAGIGWGRSPRSFGRILEGNLVTYVPWSFVRLWSCKACGECCRWFKVPVSTREYSKIGQVYGYDVFELGLGVAYLRKREQERCIFQFREGSRWLCGLQADKPHVCKMWPLIVSKTPLYGRPEAALWQDQQEKLYVYIDPRCPNIILGKTGEHFLEKVLPEFVEIAFGKRRFQEHSTHWLDRIITDRWLTHNLNARSGDHHRHKTPSERR